MSSLQLRNYSWLQTDTLAYGETKSDYDNFDKFQTYHHATKFFVFRKIKSEDFSQVPWFLPKREVVFQASKGGLILTLLSGDLCKSGPGYFASEESFPSNFAQ